MSSHLFVEETQSVDLSLRGRQLADGISELFFEYTQFLGSDLFLRGLGFGLGDLGLRFGLGTRWDLNLFLLFFFRSLAILAELL